MVIKGWDIVNENEYWLISNDTVETIRKRLTSIQNGGSKDLCVKNALMYLDTGLHKCGVKPYDM